MPGKFSNQSFSEIDLNDPFFDSLKADYANLPDCPNFDDWFHKKAAEGRRAFIFEDDEGLGAFIALKEESCEEIRLTDRVLPAISRLKISTFRIAERYRGLRIGEGALGLVLCKWQELGFDEIYVTTFDKQEKLIAMFEKFGFTNVGVKASGEQVYLRSRKHLDYSDPYKAFPFIKPNFDEAGYVIINDYYHDSMFLDAVLKNTVQERVELSVSNGVSKVYVGEAYSIGFHAGDPIFIYRRHSKDDGQRGHKSCVTSYGIATDVVSVKSNGQFHMAFEDFVARAGNKTVYAEEELRTTYETARNVVLIDILYYGSFGAGNNVNWHWLNNNGLLPNGYPMIAQLSREQFETILREGNVDVQNVIID